MIPFTDLSFSPPETIYEWQSPDTGQIRMWAIDRLNKWLETSGREISKTSVKAEMAKFFISSRGIEQHRIERLLAAPDEVLIRPIVIMTLDSGGPNPHLTLDGHHRYVVFHMLRQKFIPLYVISEADAAPFEISGVPRKEGTVLDPSRFSGLY